MLRHRLITGPLMIALLLGLLLVDGWIDRIPLTGSPVEPLFLGRSVLPAGLIMLGLFIVLILLGVRELVRIVRAKGVEVSYAMAALGAIIGCVLMYIIPHHLESQTTLAIHGTAMVLIFGAALFNHSYFQQRTQGAILAGAVTLFIMIYCGVLPGFYLGIRRWHSPWVVATIMLCTKSCDIGAYFTGRLLGRHKLILWLSPGKTWEGLAGGILLSILLTVCLAALANRFDLMGRHDVLASGQRVYHQFDVPLWYAALGGLLLGFFGQVGDLTASLFKRDAGIKDSGRSIPGFGGVLDVVDSPILVAPLAYWLLVLAAELAKKAS